MASDRTILAVDDDPIIRELIVTIFSTNGYQVCEAENGLKGLETVQSRAPDLVLLDVDMPKMSGIEMVQHLKKDPKMRQIPVIMLTGRCSKSDTIFGLDAGADDYVPKPFAAGELLARVRALLRLRDLQNELVRLEQEQIQSRLSFARDVQRCLLPQELPALKSMDLALQYRPYEAIGGDFYDLLSPADGQLCLVLGDAEGHDVSAALWMATARAYVRATFDFSKFGPGELLTKVNRLICHDFGNISFLPMVCVFFDLEKNILRYANAGHSYPILFQASQARPLALESTGPMLGLDDSQVFQEVRMPFTEGDLLACFTDGLTDVLDSHGDPFGSGRIEALVRAYQGANLTDMAERLLSAWKDHAGDRVEDDLTLILAKRLPAAPQ